MKHKKIRIFRAKQLKNIAMPILLMIKIAIMQMKRKSSGKRRQTDCSKKPKKQRRSFV